MNWYAVSIVIASIGGLFLWAYIENRKPKPAEPESFQYLMNKLSEQFRMTQTELMNELTPALLKCAAAMLEFEKTWNKNFPRK